MSAPPGFGGNDDGLRCPRISLNCTCGPHLCHKHYPNFRHGELLSGGERKICSDLILEGSKDKGKKKVPEVVGGNSMVDQTHRRKVGRPKGVKNKPKVEALLQGEGDAVLVMRRRIKNAGDHRGVKEEAIGNSKEPLVLIDLTHEEGPVAYSYYEANNECNEKRQSELLSVMELAQRMKHKFSSNARKEGGTSSLAAPPQRPAMSGGDDPQNMIVDNGQLNAVPTNSRALVVSAPPAVRHAGPNPPPLFPKEEPQNGNYGLLAESIENRSKKLQDDLLELGEKIKHHEDNIRYLKNLRNKLDSLTLDLQVSLGKYHTGSFSNGDPVAMESEEEIIQHILKYENSAAAILCKIKCNPEVQGSDNSLTKDMLGCVATLAKVDDANLSRLLSEFLGLETMLAVVCKTYEGVKALEGYTTDGSINKGSGIHALASSSGRSLENQFLVICLENLRPYPGAVIVDDLQRRLDILKPRIISGETPPGFLGFAVNMVTIDSTNLYRTSKTGHSLRETLFYNLFSDLQVYRSREEMMKALPYIKHGAISLDGGVIRSSGFFSLGHHRGNIDVKFPCDSKRRHLPERYSEIENQLKETKWKKDRAWEDMKREEAILEHTKCNYETKKNEYVTFIAESSKYAAQMGRVSTPM